MAAVLALPKMEWAAESNFGLFSWHTGYFQAKLPSVLRIYRDTLTADMKNAIKTAVADLLPVLLAQPLESDFTQGERSVDADGRLNNVT